MPKLTAEYRKKLLWEQALEESLFQYEDLIVDRESTCWKDRYFGKIIFCEGYKAVNNPFFNWLQVMNKY